MKVSLVGPNGLTLCGKTCTAAGLAHATGLSRSFVHCLLKGKRKASAENLDKIARALGVDRSRLERELESRAS